MIIFEAWRVKWELAPIFFVQMLTEIGRRTFQYYGIYDLGELLDLNPPGLRSENFDRIQIWGVLRQYQLTPSLNMDWRPERGFYARITLSASEELGMDNAPIHQECRMYFPIQLIYEWEDRNRLTNYLIACGVEKILQSIANLGASLNLPITEYAALPDFKNIAFPIRMVRVAPEQDAIVDLVILVENRLAFVEPEQAECTRFMNNAERDEPPNPSDPGNQPRRPQDEGEPPIPAAPYDRDTGDEGESYPHPPIVTPPPAAQEVLITIRRTGAGWNNEIIWSQPGYLPVSTWVLREQAPGSSEFRVARVIRYHVFDGERLVPSVFTFDWILERLMAGITDTVYTRPSSPGGQETPVPDSAPP